MNVRSILSKLAGTGALWALSKKVSSDTLAMQKDSLEEQEIIVKDLRQSFSSGNDFKSKSQFLNRLNAEYSQLEKEKTYLSYHSWFRETVGFNFSAAQVMQVIDKKVLNNKELDSQVSPIAKEIDKTISPRKK